MAGKQVDANVGVNITPKGMEGALNSINGKLEKLVANINKAGMVTNQQLKALAIASKNIDSIQNFNVNRTFGGTEGLQSLGKRAAAFAEINRATDATSRSMDVLRGRVRAVDVEFGQLARKGVALNNNDILSRDKISGVAQEYSKLTNKVQDLRSRIAMMGETNRRAFEPMLRSFDELDKRNATVFANPNRSDFRTEMTSTREMVRGMEERVRVRERLDAKTRLNIESLREEGRQLMTNNRLEQESARAAAVRQGQKTLRNQELSGGDGGYRRQIDLTQRLATQTNYLTLAKSQLNRELAKPVEAQNAARINQLLARYKMLQREIGLTTAMQMKQDASASSRTGGFIGGFKSTAKGLLGDEGGGMFGAGALVGRVGAYAVAAGAIYGVIAAIQQGVAFTVQFEDALAQLQAISGSTTLEMERLSEGILDVSKNSASSVLEITKAATVIAQAGYAGAELQDMLDSVINLSAASGATPDQAVDLLTSALGAFQLSASESARITDVLVSMLNESKLAVGQVQLGLQYLGTTAADNNITFEELTASIASMADAGIRSGSTAATGMRQMLIDFMDPSEKLIAQLERIGLTTADIDVKVLGLNEVLTRLRDSGFQAYGTIETRAAAAYTAMSAQIENTDRLIASSQNAGIAQQAAELRTDSLTASWQQLLNTLAETGALISEFVIPPLKFLVDTLTAFTSIFNELFKGLNQLESSFDSMVYGIEATGVSAEGFQKKLEDAGLSLEEVSELMFVLGDSMGDAATLAKDAEANFSDLETQQKTLEGETEKLIMRQDSLVGTSGNLSETTAAVTQEIDLLSGRFPGLREEFSKTEGGVFGLIEAMVALEDQSRRTLRASAEAMRLAAQEDKLAAGDEAESVQALVRRMSIIPFGTKSDRTRFNQFEQAVNERRWQDALDIQRNAPKGSAFQNNRGLIRTAGRIASFRQQYTGAEATERNASRFLEQDDYLNTGDGRQFRRDVRVSSANAQTASSQGNVGGVSRQEIARQVDARIARYQGLYDSAQEKDPNGAIATLLAGGLSSLRASANLLKPEEEQKKKERAGRSGRGAAERRERELKRIDSRIQKEELEYRKQLYENTLDAFENAPDLEQLPDVLNDLDNQLRSWLDGESELALQEIEAMNATPEQKAAMMETAGRKAAELREEQVNKIADTFAGVMKSFIDSSLFNIENAYANTMRPYERAQEIGQARVQGLSNPLTEKGVPDYMRTVIQRQADEASDRTARASIPAGETRIRDLLALAEKVRKDKELLEESIAKLGKVIKGGTTADNTIVVTGQLNLARAELRGINEELKKIDTETEGLIDTNAALRASYDVLKEVPTTFGAGMRMALEAVKLDIGAAGGIGQELIKNLDQPLRALHEGFKGFFSDVLSGTVSLGDAFQNMAGRIIDAILEMVAVALANQFFQLLAGMFMGAAAPAGGGGGYSAKVDSWGVMSPGSFAGGNWRGGEVKGMYAGGPINTGLPTRDSTLIHAAKGEYVVRRAAASNLGRGFLDAINARGTDALRGLGGGAIAMPAPAQQLTNVYVVKPDEKPQLGPNDVLVIIQDDMLQGGATKQLVKQISQGMR